MKTFHKVKNAPTKKELVENPASNFEVPKAILKSPVLTPVEKGEALKNWAEDAERLSVAADEGMTGGERSLLPEVKAAEAVLERQIKETEAQAPQKRAPDRLPE